MKRMILTGTLVLATGLTSLMAQAKKDNPPAQGQQQGQAQLIPGTKSAGESQALIALIREYRKSAEHSSAASD